MAKISNKPLTLGRILELTVQFIFYWTIMSALVLLFSPILIPLMILQVCLIDFKYWDIYKGIYKGWADLASGKTDLEARRMFIKEERARRRHKKAIDENTYRRKLSYGQKIDYDKMMETVGYDPDTDPDASHIRHPYKPTFKVPEDIDLRDRLRDKWKYMANAAAKFGTITKSFWDMVGRDKVQTIFLEAYKTPFFTPMEINNELEHLWVVETCSVPYYDVEYHLEMLLRLQSKLGSRVAQHREFKIRYRLLHSMMVRLRERESQANTIVKKTMDLSETTAVESFDNMIDGIFAWTRANQEVNLFMNQCEFFEREAKKGRNHG